MGKTLFVVRHALAKPTESGKLDIDRELASEGLQQAARLGVYMYKHNMDISTIVCSNAVRAVQTAELISDQINFDFSKIVIDPELYEASVRIIGNKVCEFTNDRNEVIIVGHNPVLSYFVEYLTGHHFEGMEPGSLVKISCGVDDWSLVSNENSSFEYYVSPDDFSVEN